MFADIRHDDSSYPFRHRLLKDWAVAAGAPLSFDRDDLQDIDEDGDLFPSSSVVMGHQVVISFAGLVRFALDFERRLVIPFERSASLTAADLHHFLFDHIAPRIIAGLEYVVLHGAAIAINGTLAILIGETGAGKSTLAASLKAKGHQLLGDDAVVVTQRDGVFYGDAIYASLRLYPQSVDAIYAGNIATSAMAHYSDKLRVDLPPPVDAETQPLPISAIFHLSTSPASGPPEAVKLTPLATCMKCTEQSFALDPHDGPAAARRMDRVAKLASRIPGYALQYPRDFEILPQVHQLIEQEVAASMNLALPGDQTGGSR